MNSCNVKAEFSAAIIPAFRSHDPSEIILIGWSGAQETFRIIITVENSKAAKYFCENINKMHVIVFTAFINLNTE